MISLENNENESRSIFSQWEVRLGILDYTCLVLLTNQKQVWASIKFEPMSYKIRRPWLYMSRLRTNQRLIRASIKFEPMSYKIRRPCLNNQIYKIKDLLHTTEEMTARIWCNQGKSCRSVCLCRINYHFCFFLNKNVIMFVLLRMCSVLFRY